LIEEMFMILVYELLSF